jgi:hypothetical protein
LSNYDGATITLSDDAVDATVKLDSSTEAATLVYTAATNKATVTGFDSTADEVNVDALNGTETTVASVTGNITSADDKVFLLTSTTAGDADTAGAVATAASAAAVWTAAAVNTTAYIFVADDNSSALYKFVDVGNSVDEVASTELTLLGTFDDILVSGDIVMA